MYCVTLPFPQTTYNSN